MRRVPTLAVIALVVLGCQDSPTRVAGPTANAPDAAPTLDVQRSTTPAAPTVAAADDEPTFGDDDLTADVGLPARCTQSRWSSEGLVARSNDNAQVLGGCNACLAGRRVSQTTTIFNGAAGNNAYGRAQCRHPITGALITIAGNVLVSDPGLTNIRAATYVGVIPLSANGYRPLCVGPLSTITNVLNRSNRLVTCIWH
jgi:hypothetical protein